jgi:hypothetical protein
MMTEPTLAATSASAQQQTESVETRIGRLDFELGLPTEQTVTKLFDEVDFQRAVQCYIWSLPIVGMEQLINISQANSGARDGEVTIAEGYRNVSAYLTANATTPYVFGAIDLGKSGPTVLAIPPGLIGGSVVDMWQRATTDIGVTGPDKGRGAKFLLVGPGQQVPEVEGYVVVPSPTFRTVFFFRALDPDPVKANALKTSVQVYPFAQRGNPTPTRYITPTPDMSVILSYQPRGLQYWKVLSEALANESVEDRDRFFMAMLKPLGIEKGKPFAPDERQTKLLTEATFVGEAMAKANSFDKRFTGARYRPDAHWDYVIMVDPRQDLSGFSQLDERAAYTYEAVLMSQAMVTKTPGQGSTYLASYRDSTGSAFDGASTYQLHVPPNPPAKQFWSITLYDLSTRCLIQNKEQLADRSSRQPDLMKNADGSVDLYFSPTAPKGFENNWIPTVPGQAWFTYLRLYAPTEAYFDKTWKLPDIVKLKYLGSCKV